MTIAILYQILIRVQMLRALLVMPCAEAAIHIKHFART
jgi:hypothetical protein